MTDSVHLVTVCVCVCVCVCLVSMAFIGGVCSMILSSTVYGTDHPTCWYSTMSCEYMVFIGGVCSILSKGQIPPRAGIQQCLVNILRLLEVSVLSSLRDRSPCAGIQQHLL